MGAINHGPHIKHPRYISMNTGTKKWGWALTWRWVLTQDYELSTTVRDNHVIIPNCFSVKPQLTMGSQFCDEWIQCPWELSLCHSLISQAIKAFYPAIQTAIDHRGWLGLHEYSAPHMWSEFDNTTGEGW